LASADQKWNAGDRPGAVVLYRRLLEQAGPSSEYGARAAARLALSDATTNGTPAVSAAPVETGATIKPEVPGTPPARPAEPPGIDTSDLPGTK